MGEDMTKHKLSFSAQSQSVDDFSSTFIIISYVCSHRLCPHYLYTEPMEYMSKAVARLYKHTTEQMTHQHNLLPRTHIQIYQNPRRKGSKDNPDMRSC